MNLSGIETAMQGYLGEILPRYNWTLVELKRYFYFVIYIVDRVIIEP